MMFAALWRAIPRAVRRSVFLLAGLAAIYVVGDCHGRTVQRQQDTTDAEARLTARLAHQRDSLTKHAYAQGAVAQAARDTLRVQITRYVTRRDSLPRVTVTPASAQMDTLRLRYPDSTVATFLVPDSVAAFIGEQNRQLAMADTLLQRQVQTAMQADSAAMATLWAAGRVSDSLVAVQAKFIDRLNRSLARATHGPVWDTVAGCASGAAAGGSVGGSRGAILGGVVGCATGLVLHDMRH